MVCYVATVSFIFPFQKFPQCLKVIEERLTQVTIVERCCGMVDREDRDSIGECMGFSVSCGDFEIGEEVPERVATQGDDDFWFDERDLQLEPRHALLLFLICRIAVIRWAIFDDITDVDFFALETDRCEEFIEELSCRSDEWPSKFIFLLPWSFTDEHDGCMRISFTQDWICSFMERASFPLFQLFL